MRFALFHNQSACNTKQERCWACDASVHGLAGGWWQQYMAISFFTLRYFRLMWYFTYYKIKLSLAWAIVILTNDEQLSKNLLVSIHVNLLEHGLLWTRSFDASSSEACLLLIVLISSWQNVTNTGLEWVCSKSRYPTYALKPEEKHKRALRCWFQI